MLKHILIVALFHSGGVPAQEKFPAMTGETADGRTVTLPDPKEEGFTLVALAFGKGAQSALEEWMEPAYLRFVAKHGLFASTYSCNAWFVPVFVGLNKAAYEPSMKELRKSAEPDVVEHVLFFKGEFDAIRTTLGLGRSDTPYFFVLDASGHIIHRTEGAFSEDKLDAIEAVMME